MRAKVEDLHESNPMLGHRGCRLGITFPEITAMQARAILEAACLVKKEGQDVHPEIMIPLVGTKKELEHQAAIVREVAADVFAEQGVEVAYMVGTMIEIPRAALTADEIAEVAEFFSFGTNDLTQMTLGVSRDDAGKFLPLYTSEALEIWPADPFATLDQSGVGQLVEIGIERGRTHAAGPQGRHLRRARRRPRDGQVLPPREDGLRELLAVPRAGRAPRRGAGRHRGERRAAAREVAEATTTGAGPGRREARPGRRFSLAGARGRPMARLGREIEVKLADGRALVVRDARKRDARGVTEMLDAVAAEPQVTLVLRPGEAASGGLAAAHHRLAARAARPVPGRRLRRLRRG